MIPASGIQWDFIDFAALGVMLIVFLRFIWNHRHAHPDYVSREELVFYVEQHVSAHLQNGDPANDRQMLMWVRQELRGGK